jgi:hypothetical protein
VEDVPPFLALAVVDAPPFLALAVEEAPPFLTLAMEETPSNSEWISVLKLEYSTLILKYIQR